MTLLLDTCVLLWLADDPACLPPGVRKELADKDTRVHVSAMSALELGIKQRRGKLELPLPIGDWFAAMCRRSELDVVVVDAAIAAASAELPEIHRDPFDRVLIATAQRLRLVLVTPDETIRRYPDLDSLWA